MNEGDTATGNASLFAKMARIMGAMESVHKDKNHPQGWAYASAGAVATEIRKRMAAEKVAFLPRTVKVETVDEARWLVTYEFTFADGDTGETQSCLWFGEAMKVGYRKDGTTYPDDKALAKAATTAVKYFLLKTFIVSTEDDPDADSNASNQYGNQKPATPKKQQPPTPQLVPNGKGGKQAPLPNGANAKGERRVGGSPEAEPVALNEQIVTYVEVKQTKSGSQYILTEGDISTFTRQPFRDAGVECEAWDKPGKYTLDKPITVLWMPDGEDNQFRKVVEVRQAV